MYTSGSGVAAGQQVVYSSGSGVGTTGQQVVYTTGIPQTNTTYTYEQPVTTTTTYVTGGEKAVNARYFNGTYTTGGNSTYDYGYTAGEYASSK